MNKPFSDSNFLQGKKINTLKGFESYLFSVKDEIKNLSLSSHGNTAQKRALLGLMENYSPEALHKRSLALADGGPAPEGYVLGITDQCNLRCMYCYSKSAATNRHDMNLDAARTLIAEMYQAFGITLVTISGGEPFPKVFSLAERCPSTTLYVYTNGTRIDKTAATEIKKIGTIIPSLTIIGAEPIHDRIRGFGSYAKVMNAVEELRRENLIWGFSVTESKANLNYILDGSLFELLSQFNPFFIRMIPFVPVGEEESENLCLPPGCGEKIKKAITNAKAEYGIIIHDYVHDDTLGIGCMAGGQRYFYVDPQFRMSACVFMGPFEQIVYDPKKKCTNSLEILRGNELMSKARTLAGQYRCIARDKPDWQSDHG